jgi:hypothetical protein
MTQADRSVSAVTVQFSVLEGIDISVAFGCDVAGISVDMGV